MPITNQHPQAGVSDSKQAEEKKMKEERTHRPTQVMPGQRLLAGR